MIKHPALRVSNIADVDSEFLDSFYADLLEFKKLCPFGDLIEDFEITGSYAAGRAKLHSDVDINLALGTQENVSRARVIVRERSEEWATALRYLHHVADEKYGVILQLQMQFATMKTISHLMCYSLTERKTYGTQTERTPKLVTPKVWSDDAGDFVDLIPDVNDPYLSELPKYRKKYGAKFLNYGDTPETAHMKRR